MQGIVANDKGVTISSRETVCGSLVQSERAQGGTNYQGFQPLWRN